MNSAVETSRDTSGNLDDGSKEGSQQSATEIKLESEPEPVQEPEPEQIPDPEPVPCHEQKPEVEHEGERKVTPEPVPDEIAEQAEEPAEENKATQENDTDASMVQLFSSHSGNTIKGIEMQFTELLTNQLKNINFVKCNQLEDIDSKEMLIVLCIISSRVGTDAAYAIKDINNPANTVLMLIHNKKNHALPKLTSSSVLTDQKFRKLGGVFDLAFFDGRGIYKCEMNDIALKRVCTFIKQNRIDRI
ncbi:uncharacterized protein LOC128558520 [Mercenaria mercenaria]|uniref:uncharacterized protein LOC128558520 n=1 Tax=Mercenaria mercenaria TaxID=6596 RepID=UPI00234E420F|nr:uncharacterized protein LOC128558520 [Mercenaria mercenaria]